MPTIKIHNVETNEEIEREMNAAELKQWEADKLTVAAELKKINQAAQAKAALLDKLGITEEEAKLLLS